MNKLENNLKSLKIRNSTVEFLIFTKQTGEGGIEVVVADENVWLTQKMMTTLYDTTKQNISLHLSNIFNEKELVKTAIVKDFLTVQKEGEREVKRVATFYSLEAIIAVGYRINSERAIQFRQWATTVLKDFAIKGYVLDKKRLENGAYLDESYYEHLLEEIQEIRASERKFYQKITDIYATAMDYYGDSEITKNFYKTVQNKLHFAIHGHTAAELIVDRVSAEKKNMGLTSWNNAPKGKIVKSDVSIAKNFLTKEELKDLDGFVVMYLDYAERQAKRRIPMTMTDWTEKLNAFLKFNDYDILNNAGIVTAAIAKSFAESEFEKYRIVQDRLFESDFDRLLKDFQTDNEDKK